MKKRPATVLVPSLLLSAAATSAAQTPVPLARGAAALAGPVRYAGQYHVDTGTWIRRPDPASRAGLAIVYSNTAGSGYFEGAVGPQGGAAGGEVIDAGVVPAPDHPGPFPFGVGDPTTWVEQVTIGYCDFDPAPGVAGFELDFYQSYNPCTFPPDPAQLAGSVALVGAPSNGCWSVDVVVPGFVLNHEGDGVHDGDMTVDRFGVAWRYTGAGTEPAGLLLGGDPANTDPGWTPGNEPSLGSNTYYGGTSGCPGFGSGFETGDYYWVEDSMNINALPGGSNCYFFGGYRNVGNSCGGPIRTPYASAHLEVRGQPFIVDVFPISDEGCTGFLNATGVPGEIFVYGQLQAAENNAELRATNLPSQQFGIFLTGLVPLAPGAFTSGNGTLCISPGAMGGLGRFDGAQQIRNTGSGGEMSLGTTAGEWDLSMIPTSTGTYAATVGITSHFQAWHREPVGAGFNFSGSCLVTWH